MEINNLKNIATELQTISGVKCFVEPIQTDIKETHIKLEYVGRYLNRELSGNKSEYGALKLNLVFRGDGNGLNFIDEVIKADFKLCEAIESEYDFSDNDYNYRLESADTANEDFGLQFPEQSLGVAEPDSTNDVGTRRIYTRIFQIKIKFSKRS